MYYSDNTYDTFRPLSWILKLFAINSNVENARMSACDVIRVVINAFVLGSLNVLSLYYKIKYHYSIVNMSIKFTDAIQMIYDYCQYIVDLYFVYKYGRLISAQYFKQYDILDNILGITSYKAIKRRLIKLILIFTGIWITTSCFDFFAWILSYCAWKTSIVYSVSYIYLYIKMATMLDITSHVMHVELRLAIIGDLIQNYYTRMDCSSDFDGECIVNKNWLYANARSRTPKCQVRPHAIKPRPEPAHHEWKLLTRCYLMLTDQVAYINSMYGLRILLNSLSLLIDMVRYTNIAVRFVQNTQTTPYNTGYLPAASNLMRQLACGAIFINLAYHCEKVYLQRDRIITTIDALLIYKDLSNQLASEVAELRTLITNRPIYFHMANFFRINYSLLASIASVVVTYTIILLQSPN